jgi:ribonuclease-3
MIFRVRKYKDLEKRLGYKFRDEELLAQALTHSSVRGSDKARKDNERLEFLGDRVLGLATVEKLSAEFPKAKEGELARRYNTLVNGGMCAKVGRELGLGAFLILSESEADSGGRDKDTILADAVEAVLGAAFLDGGYAKARTIVFALWDKQAESKTKKVTSDAKSALQEWAQGQGFDRPEYSEVSRSGPDHAPLFIAEVKIKGRGAARGEGNSKRAAEQAAAADFLHRQGLNAERHNA